MWLFEWFSEGSAYNPPEHPPKNKNNTDMQQQLHIPDKTNRADNNPILSAVTKLLITATPSNNSSPSPITNVNNYLSMSPSKLSSRLPRGLPDVVAIFGKCRSILLIGSRVIVRISQCGVSWWIRVLGYWDLVCRGFHTRRNKY